MDVQASKPQPKSHHNHNHNNNQNVLFLDDLEIKLNEVISEIDGLIFIIIVQSWVSGELCDKPSSASIDFYTDSMHIFFTYFFISSIYIYKYVCFTQHEIPIVTFDIQPRCYKRMWS